MPFEGLPDWARMFLAMLLLFGGALAFAFFLGKAIMGWRGSPPALEPGSILHLRAATGIYRTRLQRAAQRGWIIDAPLHQNQFVPLRPGEAIYVDAPVQDGVLRFKSVIEAREADPHRFLITVPRYVQHVERREEVRDQTLAGTPATVRGHAAEIIDISRGGAALATKAMLYAGDAVRVAVPALEVEADAYVLAVWPGMFGGRVGSHIRVCFEQPLTFAKKKTAPRSRGV